MATYTNNKKCKINLGVGLEGDADGTPYNFYCEDLASLFTFEYEFELDHPVEAILGKGKSSVSLALEAVNKISAAAKYLQNSGTTQDTNGQEEGDQIVKSAWSKLPTFKGVKPITFKSQIDLKFYWGIDGTYNPQTEIMDKVIALMKYFAPSRTGGIITPPLPTSSTLLAATIKNMVTGNLVAEETEGESEGSEVNDSNSEVTTESSGGVQKAVKIDTGLLTSLAKELNEIINSFNSAVETTFTGKYGTIMCTVSCGNLKSPVFFPKGVSIEFDTSSIVKHEGKYYPIGATVSLKNCQTPLLPYKGLVSKIALTDDEFKKYYAY